MMKRANRTTVALAAAASLVAIPGAAQAGDAPPGITLKITASCLPMPDLSVSDCRLVDSDPDSAPPSMKDDPIIRDGIAQISKVHLPADWRTTFKMDAGRVIIPMRIILRKVG